MSYLKMNYFFIYIKKYKQFIQVNQPGHIGQCSANHPGICGCSSLLGSPTLPSAAVIFGVEKPVSSLAVTLEGWTIEPMMFGCHKRETHKKCRDPIVAKLSWNMFTYIYHTMRQCKDKLREGNYNFITYQWRRWWNHGWLLSNKMWNFFDHVDCMVVN